MEDGLKTTFLISFQQLGNLKCIHVTYFLFILVVNVQSLNLVNLLRYLSQMKMEYNVIPKWYEVFSHSDGCCLVVAFLEVLLGFRKGFPYPR